MPGHDRHGPREIAIFSRFAEVCDLPVQLDSIEKREPPEPDIWCMIAGEGPVAFEMVELIHSDLAELSSRSMMSQQLLEEAYQRLPAAQRAALEKRYGNALVSIAFRLTVPSSGRRGSIPGILSWLQGLEPAFTGDICPEARSALGRAVRKITIRRGRFTGPCFDVDAAGIIADPPLDPIRAKFAKSYSSKFPMELLVYNELQLVWIGASWVSRLHACLAQMVEGSQFRHVWIFDVQNNAVTFAWERQ